MIPANKQQHHARHQVGLTVAFIILMSAASLATGPIRESSAQADAPSWSYTGSPHTNGPASRVSSFNQPVFGQTTATTAAKAGWRFTSSMSTKRFRHSATRLEDGKVLIAGGEGGECFANPCPGVSGSSELYDPIRDTWSVTGELRQRRAGHSATLLKDGRVLIAGGTDSGIYIGGFSELNSAELYDPATGEWRRTAKFNRIFGVNSATLLANGKVLAMGSSKPTGHSAELYDPVTETWSITAAPSQRGTAVLLPDGKVLVLVLSKENEIYDPATETWSSAGQRNTLKWARTGTLLTNGKVLATGTDESGLPGAELYDPNTGAWSVTGPPLAGLGTVTLLPEGRVLTSGGGFTSENLASGEAEIYDPETGQWSLTDRLKAPRFGHTATLLVDGRVLVAGGSADEEVLFILDSAELYGLIPIIRITSASVSGKKLFLSGENFLVGAVILLNGEEEKTKNDDQNPSTMLIGKKAGKKIKPGDRVQVRNPDGTLSEEFIFTGS